MKEKLPLICKSGPSIKNLLNDMLTLARARDERVTDIVLSKKSYDLIREMKPDIVPQPILEVKIDNVYGMSLTEVPQSIAGKYLYGFVDGVLEKGRRITKKDLGKALIKGELVKKGD